MKSKLKILMTAAGAPQAPTLIRHLRGNGEREVEIISLDMNSEACGRFLSDAFFQIPPAGAEGYAERILEIVEKQRPDAFLNVSGSDVPVIARMRKEIEDLGTVVVASDPDAIETANNKYLLYSTLKGVPDVQVPEFRTPSTLEEFVAVAREMGYPGRDLCFKPHVSKGSRGFRILSEKFDRRDLLLNHKPTAVYMSMEEFRSIFGGGPDFPRLLLMEVASGEECDVMTIG